VVRRADTHEMADAVIHRTHAVAARRGPRSGWIVVFLAIASAAAYAWIRIPTGAGLHIGLQHSCTTLEMRPGDWLCQVTATQGAVTFAGGSLLLALALAAPCAVLIATGRRLTGFVPLFVPLAALAGMRLVTGMLSEHHGVEQPFLGIYEATFAYGQRPATYWELHRGITIAIDSVLLAAPLVAFALVRARRRDAEPTGFGPRPTARSGMIAAAACGTGIWAAATLAGKTVPGMDAFLSPQPEDLWLPIAVIASFGALLGPDRRWWPWVLAPAAFLLSGALSDTLFGTVYRWDSFWRWGSTVPLFLAGMIASGWRPLALRIDRARGMTAVAPAAIVETRTDPARRVRPVVVANALAAALLVTCLIAVRYDPLQVEIAISLPTYLGARDAVADQTTKQRLDDALGVVAAYAADHDMAGFDATTGARAGGSLRWIDGLPSAAAGERPPGRSVSVLPVAGGVQLVALSGSGHGICVQAGSHGRSTFGVSSVQGGWSAAMADAVRHCTDRAFDAAALRPFPIESLCNDVGDESIMICRAVQRLLRRMGSGASR
jgi:hypothetical protein